MKKMFEFMKGQVVGDGELLNITSEFPVEPRKRSRDSLGTSKIDEFKAYTNFKVTVEYTEDKDGT